MPAQFVLRELAGVAELEARLHRIEAHPNPEWALERENLDEDTQRLSDRLFGITFLETYFDRTPMEEDPEWEYDEDDYEAAERSWDMHFKFLDSEDDAARSLIWDAIGWDVTDGRGEELLALDYLDRMMVCATKGLCGRLPGAPANDAELAERAEDWGGQLAEEAAKFRARARR